ncbi:nuclear transport factor 2 family protein, partial [Nocardia farcinica]
MPLDASGASLLAAVQASPRAVAAHDRQTWVGLFTADATVRDPVGARPHTGRAAIEKFFDTF